MSCLVAERLSKKFRSRRVVDEVSFEVHAGQVVGLLGPNGAGKTTSFYMVVGLISPDSGKVLLDDIEIQKSAMYLRARRGISYLPQEPSIFRNLKVKDNILMALEAKKKSRASRMATLERLLNDFAIGYIADHYGYSLSGGERRRVEIARSLASEPKFLLLDEPFAGIDPIAVNDLQKLIKKLAQDGIGILITDHNVRETLGICDYSYLLNDAKIQVKGTAAEISCSELARKLYLGANFKL